jgi:hypothetical protein
MQLDRQNTHNMQETQYAIYVKQYVKYEKYVILYVKYAKYAIEINMQNMQKKICNFFCKMCKQYAGLDDITLYYCMQFAKYAKKYA